MLLQACFCLGSSPKRGFATNLPSTLVRKFSLLFFSALVSIHGISRNFNAESRLVNLQCGRWEHHRHLWLVSSASLWFVSNFRIGKALSIKAGIYSVKYSALPTCWYPKFWSNLMFRALNCVLSAFYGSYTLLFDILPIITCTADFSNIFN